MDPAAALTQAPEPSDRPITLETVTLARGAAPQDIVAGLDTWGIVAVPDAIDDGTLDALNREFDSMLALPDGLAHKIDQTGDFFNIRVKPARLRETGYRETWALFTQPFMTEVAHAFFGSPEVEINDEAFISRTGATTDAMMNQPPFALHFDKREVLKFFYYLTDTDERNGALRASPGSHTAIRQYRRDQMAAGTPLNDITNVVEGRVGAPMSMNGAAGTMLVFTTDVAHGHSTVQPGFTRRTMRGHTHSHEMLRAMGYM